MAALSRIFTARATARTAWRPAAHATGAPTRRWLTARAESGGSGGEGRKWDNETVGAAMGGVAIVALGMSYAAVPLYRMFCQATGYGGTVKDGGPNERGGRVGARYGHLPEDPSQLARNRPIKVTFNTDMAANLPWKFKPAQSHVTLLAGETSLCFFRVTNNSDEPIVGVATYNITPMRAGQYFNKVQCFCFDQQRLLPHETVDMPVFFYIDPEFLEDPNMAGIRTLTLSYTFFRADREQKALPEYLQGMEPGAKLHGGTAAAPAGPAAVASAAASGGAVAVAPAAQSSAAAS